MATNKLTASQESFAQEWHRTGNKTAAYRFAYPKSQKWKENAVNCAAVKLSKLTKVSERFKELQNDAAERNKTDVDMIDKMHREAFEKAKEVNNPSAMTAAAKNLADLHGLAENKQSLDHKSSDGSMSSNPTVIELIAPNESSGKATA